MAKGIALLYTDEMKQFIVENQQNMTRKELTNIFNEKYETNYSVKNISSFCNRNKLHNGNNGQFQKGHISYNKGKTMSPEVYEKVKKTMFKKGNIPVNHRKVGSERITKDGYIEVKVGEPNKWKLKHRYVWEKEFGPIPKGYAIVFLDQNKLNTDIANLKLITRGQLAIINKRNVLTTNTEINKAIINLSKLELDTNRLKTTVAGQKDYLKRKVK